mmetsp:Transcript_38178/g.76778  ORF Transcript_38178/g.76778 Transcript_38178/m.76778 type:complete len:282 (+) Transcript_38178:871-1716(+)
MGTRRLPHTEQTACKMPCCPTRYDPRRILLGLYHDDLERRIQRVNLHDRDCGNACQQPHPHPHDRGLVVRRGALAQRHGRRGHDSCGVGSDPRRDGWARHDFLRRQHAVAAPDPAHSLHSGSLAELLSAEGPKRQRPRGQRPPRGALRGLAVVCPGVRLAASPHAGHAQHGGARATHRSECGRSAGHRRSRRRLSRLRAVAAEAGAGRHHLAHERRGDRCPRGHDSPVVVGQSQIGQTAGGPYAASALLRAHDLGLRADHRLYDSRGEWKVEQVRRGRLLL